MNTVYLEFLNRVKEAKKVKIFGTGKVAKTLYYLFRREGIEIEAFVVSIKKADEDKFFDIPVLQLDSVKKENLKNIVVAFEKREVLNEIVSKLIASGIDLGERILGALVIFIVGKFLVNWANKLLAKVLAKRKVEAGVQTFLKSMANILLMIMLGLAVIGRLGIELTGFAALLACGTIS